MFSTGIDKVVYIEPKETLGHLKERTTLYFTHLTTALADWMALNWMPHKNNNYAFASLQRSKVLGKIYSCTGLA